jgi:hypothetical protein
MNSTALRRVVSDCEDMAAEDAGGPVHNNLAQNQRNLINQVACVFVNDVNQESSFNNSHKIMHEIREGYDENISDLTLSSRADPLDTLGAPLTLIESRVGDYDQYFDNSSLSGDDSDIVSGDRDKMLENGKNLIPFDDNGNNGTIILEKRELQRMDSTSSSLQSSSQRAPSSQTSDWGFFEDVHQSSDGKKGESLRSKKNARMSIEARTHKDSSKFEIILSVRKLIYLH